MVSSCFLFFLVFIFLETILDNYFQQFQGNYFQNLFSISFQKKILFSLHLSTVLIFICIYSYFINLYILLLNIIVNLNQFCNIGKILEAIYIHTQKYGSYSVTLKNYGKSKSGGRLAEVFWKHIFFLVILKLLLHLVYKMKV